MKCKRIYIPLVIVLVLTLSLLGAAGCPTPTDRYTLTTSVSPTAGGSVSPSDGSYEAETEVTLTATPAEGYLFDYWSGSASGNDPTTTVVMDANKSATAHFTPAVQSYTLDTTVSPSGSGSVSPSDGSYEDGTEVTLTATPAEGYLFDYWSGSASGNDPTTTITMDSDKHVTANFAEVEPEVLFSDDFSQDTGNWDNFVGSTDLVSYQDGSLYVKDYKSPADCSGSLSNYYCTDFILEVETCLVSGRDDTSLSVLFRIEGLNNCYAFSIHGDGEYVLEKAVGGVWTTPVPYTYSDHINQGVGAVNLIHIECIGSSLSFSVNGYLLDTVTDTSLSSGYIGLGACANSGLYSEVTFDNLVITEPS